MVVWNVESSLRPSLVCWECCLHVGEAPAKNRDYYLQRRTYGRLCRNGLTDADVFFDGDVGWTLGRQPFLQPRRRGDAPPGA